MTKKNRYKLLLVFFLLVIAFSFFTKNNTIVFADTEIEDLEENLQIEIGNGIANLDLSAIESILSKLTTNEYSIFGSSSFVDKLSKIISGEFAKGTSNVFDSVIKLFFEDLLSILPLIATIIAIAILCSMLDGIKPNGNKGLGGIIHFVAYGIIVLLLVNSIMDMINMTSSTINIMKMQMDAIFPVLLTLLTALGGTASVGIYQPAVAFLSSSILQLFNYLLMPIFIFSLVFSIISNLSDNVKLNKFSDFFGSLFKWTIGLVFTIFMAFVGIQGITAGSFDGISIRTAKFAIRSYVPILGGYLSEGFNMIMASSILIKNAIGATGLLLMFATVLVPVVKLILYMLSLKLMAAVIEPLGSNKISSFINSLAKAITMLIVMIVGVAFMYLVLVGLIMGTANVL